MIGEVFSVAWVFGTVSAQIYFIYKLYKMNEAMTKQIEDIRRHFCGVEVIPLKDLLKPKETTKKKPIKIFGYNLENLKKEFFGGQKNENDKLRNSRDSNEKDRGSDERIRHRGTSANIEVFSTETPEKSPADEDFGQPAQHEHPPSSGEVSERSRRWGEF